MNKKIILIVIAALVALGAGYIISKQTSDNKPAQTSTASDTPLPAAMGGTLDLTGQQLTELPESALNRTDITTLNVSNNQLTSLPAAISKLANLEVLNVENNRLVTLPAELVQLKNLREIHANNNRMTSLPGELSSMTQLTLLDISGNSISASQVDELKADLSTTEIKN